jgi:hypothetical protein
MRRLNVQELVDQGYRKVAYITDMNETVVKEMPSNQRMSPSRLMPNRPKGTKFIIRRRPRVADTWEVFDARTSRMNPSMGQFYSPPKCAITAPSYDAAIGYALLMP